MNLDKNKSRRPVFLHLLKIRLPIGGIASITHRVTGILLTLCLPYGLYLLFLSLRDEAGFQQAAVSLQQPLSKLAVLLVFWIFAQHFFSGIRHLLMDIDIGISRGSGRLGAWAVFVLAFLLTAWFGVAWL